MPKAELLKRIDAPAPGKTVIVGGSYVSSSAVAVVREVAALGSTVGTQPDTAGRLQIIGRKGVRAESQAAQVIFEVDGSIPRTAFTGRMIVGRGAALLLDLPACGDWLRATEPAFAAGDLLFVQGRGQEEWLRVTAYRGPATSGYDYTVTRNVGPSAGACDWQAGDALVRVPAGGCYMELAGAQTQAGAAGPVLLFKRQTGTGSINNWTPAAALGNLFGLYDYQTEAYGAAFGPYTGNWIGVDETNGLRIMRAGVPMLRVRESESIWGEPGQPQVRIRPGYIDFMGPDGSVQASLDGITRTIYGFDRWGQPLGPALEIGPTEDGRWGQWLRGRDNVPFVALLSGTEADPDNVFVRFGAQGAGQFFEFSGGNVAVSGTVTAASGTIGGWTLAADQLSAGRAYLRAAGALNLYGGTTNKWVMLDASAATYPISAGNAVAANGPFRVDWSGNLYATGLKLLSGSDSVSGFLVDVTNNNTGAGYGAIRGTGESIGVYGTANKYGVQGSVAASNAAGVYGTNSGGPGVHGKGTPGVLAQANGAGDDALTLSGGPLNANGQNLSDVNRVYLGGTTCYLYLSGTDIYWWNGSTGVKLN